MEDDKIKTQLDHETNGSGDDNSLKSVASVRKHLFMTKLFIYGHPDLEYPLVW